SPSTFRIRIKILTAWSQLCVWNGLSSLSACALWTFSLLTLPPRASSKVPSKWRLSICASALGTTLPSPFLPSSSSPTV
ncbi:hypothetical protein BGX30_004260, partial [Mortierella sp. GBA39]